MVDQNALIDLLNQLDEGRLTDLLRSLQSDRSSPFSHVFPMLPKHVGDCNLWYKLAGKVGSWSSWAASWFFQVVHIAPSFSQDNSAFQRLTKHRVRACFEGMAKNPGICEILNSPVPPYKKFDPSLFIPFDNARGSAHFYVVVNTPDNSELFGTLLNDVELLAN
jgi:hypothetical protein